MKVFHLTATTVSRTLFSTGAAILRKLPMVLMLAIGVSLLPAAAFAQGTPDGQTPAEETVCDGLEGAAFGICNAYCEATDCGDGVNHANFRACESLQRNWVKHTGLEELPCDCEDPLVFIPGEGCGCALDLTVRILDFRPLGCPDGQGTCTYEVDIEVANLGSLDIVDPFDVLVELPGIGLGDSEAFPAGLGAGATEQRLAIPLGPGDNCFDPDCDILATADPGDVIEECDETNNRDFLNILG